MICDFKKCSNSLTFFAVSCVKNLNSSFACTFFDPLMEKPILTKDEIKGDVIKRERVSRACLTAIAAERVRDVRSLAGKTEALDGSDSRLLWRESKTNLKSSFVFPSFSSLFVIEFSKLEILEFFGSKRWFIRLTLELIFPLRDFFVLDALSLGVIVFLSSVASFIVGNDVMYKLKMFN